jgi:uncharacterized phage protein (TIGR02216 family)
VSTFGGAAAQLCNAAAIVLGWRPDEFWNSTPAELALALQAPGAEGPDRATIHALRQRFPDDAQTRPTNMKAAAPAMQANAPT